MKLIFVCTSNVCRSPLAEACAKIYVEEHKINVNVISRGLTDEYSAWGSPVNARMIEAAKSNAKVNRKALKHLQAHKAKCLRRDDLTGDSFLFLVTRQHEEWCRYTVGEKLINKAKAEGRIFLCHSKDEDVIDPFFGNEKQYEAVCRQICEEIPKVLQKFFTKKSK